ARVMGWKTGRLTRREFYGPCVAFKDEVVTTSLGAFEGVVRNGHRTRVAGAPGYPYSGRTERSRLYLCQGAGAGRLSDGTGSADAARGGPNGRPGLEPF